MWDPSRSAVWTLLAPAAAIFAPAPAFAVDYLTADQAQAEAFPAADRFEARDVDLTPAQQEAVVARLGGPLRTPTLHLRLAWRGPELVGALAVDEVIGRYEKITYALALGADGAVRQLEILTYRESHGQEVHLPPWRRQFVGKGPTSPLRVGEDIAGISGATLSCTHVTDGVRRLVAAWAALRGRGEFP